MNNAGCMQITNTAQHLIEQIGHAFVIEVHLNNLTQIRVHQFHHYVQIGKVF